MQTAEKPTDPMIDGVVFDDRNHGRVLLMRCGPCNEPWLFRKHADGQWVTIRPVRDEEIPTFIPGATFLKPGEAFAS